MIPFSYEDFEATRERLIDEIHATLTEQDRQLLISFKQGEPDWGLFPADALQRMPAVHWKLANIRRPAKSNPRKHAEQLVALEQALSV